MTNKILVCDLNCDSDLMSVFIVKKDGSTSEIACCDLKQKPAEENLVSDDVVLVVLLRRGAIIDICYVSGDLVFRRITILQVNTTERQAPLLSLMATDTCQQVARADCVAANVPYADGECSDLINGSHRYCWKDYGGGQPECYRCTST